MVASRAVPRIEWWSTISRPGLRWLVLFRWIVLGCQAATIAITWPLWSVHRDPPMLPLLPLPEVELGVPLLLSLFATLFWPLGGVVLHTAVIGYAVLIDQTRLQPEIVSLVLLLWGTLPLAGAKTVARAHLVTLWMYAGLNKLLSPAFFTGSAQWMLAGLVPNAPALLRDNAGYLVVLAEVGTGVLALIPGTRKLAALLAVVVHGAILLILSPIGLNYNQSVWPWNIALALAGPAFIAGWRERPLASLRAAHRAVQAVVVVLVVAPAGFYVGLTDAYLAHNLYSSNTPRAEWCGGNGRCVANRQTRASWRAFNVPLPPEHRLFEASFLQTCKPGERLIIRDGRAWARSHGFDRRELSCPSSRSSRDREPSGTSPSARAG